MSQENIEICNVESGPSKLDLMMSLFMSNMEHPYIVTFTVEMKGQYKGVIQSIQREDGSGESFNFTAHFYGTSGPTSGYYSTKTRKGYIRI